MSRSIRRHLSFANVTSLCALVFAMGGTGYALTIPKNSVGTKQIKKNGVASSEIKKNAVNSSKVKNRSLLATDFKFGQLPQGAAGANGKTGPPGPSGLSGLSGGTIVRRTDLVLPAGAGAGVPGTTVSAFATCGPGEKILGGSANVNVVQDPPTMELRASRPSKDTVDIGTVPSDGEAYAYWKGTARTLTNAGNGILRVFAICAVP